MAVKDEMSRRRVIIVMLVIALAVTSATVFYIAIRNVESFRGYIVIDGNGDFTKLNGVSGGKGTPLEPYSIWDLTITKAPGIVIRNTDAHVSIGVVTMRDVVLTDMEYVVTLINVKNLTMEHIFIENCRGGIYLSGSDCSISRCQVLGTEGNPGISLMDCVNCTATYNTVSHVSDDVVGSIQISDSRDCLVNLNTITYSKDGMLALHCANCEISDNQISAPNFGLNLDSSENMVVTGNRFELNGISVYGSPEEVSSHTVAASNVVGSRPILYVRDTDDVVIGNQSLGQLIVTNCSRFTARNLTINGFQDGVQMVCVDNSTLEELRIHGRYDAESSTIRPIGIRLAFCSDLDIRSSTVSYAALGILLNGHRITLENNSLVTNNLAIMGGGTEITISGNMIAGSLKEGVYLDSVNTLDLSNNTLVGNFIGVHLQYTSNVTFSGNSIDGSDRGMILYDVVDSMFYHNDFLENIGNVIVSGTSVNCSWDAGYPEGGNYWSDYYGTDMFSGVGQDIPGSDGIGDTSYLVFESLDVWDDYPLMEPMPS